jgi:hypothetical protein
LGLRDRPGIADRHAAGRRDRRLPQGASRLVVIANLSRPKSCRALRAGGGAGERSGQCGPSCNVVEQSVEPGDSLGRSRATYCQDAVAGFEASLPPADVVVRASAHAIDELSWLTRSSGRAIKERHPLDDGWTHATLAFESLDDAYTELLRLGADVEIIEPVEVRTRTIETALAMATLYTQPSRPDHPSAADSPR